MKPTREARLKLTQKAKNIADMLSLEEKVSLMSGNALFGESETSPISDHESHYNFKPYPAGGLEAYHVPPIKFCDGPRGVVCDYGKSTCFPVPILRGAAFNVALERKVGRAIAKEVRAYGGNLFGGVCVNLLYHPGWGRSQETFGEDSFHLGEMGKALVQGVQEGGVVACVKHIAFYQKETLRFTVNIECDIRTEQEVFLPHFKKCIDAGAACVMTSYNSYQGVRCGHHQYLLNHILKDIWGFDGFVISDFNWGIDDTVAAANGGMNVEMCLTKYFGDKLLQAVREGRVSSEAIDDSVVRIIRTMLAFSQNRQSEPTKDVLACKQHVRLSLECAREGMVLIQNKNSLLPLNKREHKRIVLLGKLGNETNMGDKRSSRVYPPYAVTPLQGINQVAPCTELVFNSGENIAHARHLAAAADAVILFAGYNHNDEGESLYSLQEFQSSSESLRKSAGDRKNSLGLNPHDIRLIKEVGAVNPNSAVVLIGGGMIMIEEWKDDVGAILMAFYPGMEGGTAIAEVLFGKTNPSGKLPFVIPKREKDLPVLDWDSQYQRYEYLHGYARLDTNGVEPSVPFGFGLSYTTFALGEPRFLVDGDEVVASCTVRNTGGRAGAQVVQLYVGFENASVVRPKKLLRGFQKVCLKKQETKTVVIRSPISELRWFNPASGEFELESMEYQLYIGTSSSAKDLMKGSLFLSGQ